MSNLILVLLSIALTGATLFASLNYMPGWTSAAADNYNLTRYGFVALEKSFSAATTRAEGQPPAPLAEIDGGLFSNFSADYGYLPKAPQGYAWKYGYNGSDYYFCLYPKAGVAGASEALWRGLKRARSILSNQQYFVIPGGEASCDTPAPHAAHLAEPPTNFPTMVSAVYLVRYTPLP